ncbi:MULTISPECIES: hypothetical protein [unclassified Devosia]|uniref:hypothetical protein n=1 Tax=unclassified Devosia TaxID=196773 RepID=UPI0015538D81|nr:MULTISPECIES: hypothetical protein [unclassified Devosia]
MKSGKQKILCGLGGVLWLATLAIPAAAQEQGQLFATAEEGYARLVLSFPGRDDLPRHKLRVENGVLSVEFDEAVQLVLPDVGTTLPQYLSIARLDANGRGLRVGLRSSFNFNRTEAGEKLFIDLLPADWQGMPPALPQEVLDELAERARLEAIETEQERKARQAAELGATPSVRVGRNPTFLRLQFDWNVPTSGQYLPEGEHGLIAFEWPVPVDLRDLLVDLPAEIVAADNVVTPDGSSVQMQFAKGVVPRFYQNSDRQYVLDVDLAGQGLPSLDAEDVVAEVAHAEAEAHGTEHAAAGSEQTRYPANPAAVVTPFASVLGSTVRVVFPFEQETPAAVFRRGDTVWLMFDTVAGIAAPTQSPELDTIAQEFSVVPAADTQVVRIDLAQDRLATLGSEGMAWVLSLGDVVLTPTQPMQLTRRRDNAGSFEMVADVLRPARVHEFRDPLVGDTLQVVTAYPPARGITRLLDYVEFSALRSVHGLVIKPEAGDLGVKIEEQLAVISAARGLSVSAYDAPRGAGQGAGDGARNRFIDLAALEQSDPNGFIERRQELMRAAAAAEGQQRDVARLDLAQYLVANRFAHEALGVLRTVAGEASAEELTRRIGMTEVIANTVASRSADALKVLNAPAFNGDVDALFWRAIARADLADYQGARQDAREAQGVLASYPQWARNRFLLAASGASLQTGDRTFAEQLLDKVTPAELSAEESSRYHLLTARLLEEGGAVEEAIDAYGQVIAADFRPTRAEAVYRTLLLLDGKGTLNLEKATHTLAAEALMWRGNALEAEMQKLLADLYFRSGEYRSGFEAVKQAVAQHGADPSINALGDRAQQVFEELFLDGQADKLGPVDALGLFYDFPQLTPPGARGDEMIRKLARRLVGVDLLAQAAELLQYQLENRLRGVAQTQVAADLAVIYLADRRPQDALRVLNASRLPDLPAGLARQRRLLEARAMIDGGRNELALQLLSDMDGRDADLLRVDAQWRAKRYSQASGLLETMYGQAGVSEPLSQPARMDLIKAAVGFVLANDNSGLLRLREKFAERLVKTPEWAMFDFVTGPITASSLEFKSVANEVAGLDGLNAFLASYREFYGKDGALTPLAASKADGDLASAN